MTEWDSSLDDSFAKLLGRQPSDAERQELYRIRDALELKNNDALWLVLMALQYYQDQYERFPKAIALAASETFARFKETADTLIQASAEATKADLAKAVVKTAQDVANHTAKKNMLKWAVGCLVVAFLAFGLFGWFLHSKAYDAGYNSGYGVGYMEAKDEKAAAAWANTPEGKSAYRLAQAGSINSLIHCTQPGWKIENGLCYPLSFTKNNGSAETYGWRLP
ncbi:MAG: protein mobE [Methylococcaceae bacterium]